MLEYENFKQIVVAKLGMKKQESSGRMMIPVIPEIEPFMKTLSEGQAPTNMSLKTLQKNVLQVTSLAVSFRNVKALNWIFDVCTTMVRDPYAKTIYTYFATIPATMNIYNSGTESTDTITVESQHLTAAIEWLRQHNFVDLLLLQLEKESNTLIPEILSWISEKYPDFMSAVQEFIRKVIMQIELPDDMKACTDAIITNNVGKLADNKAELTAFVQEDRMNLANVVRFALSMRSIAVLDWIAANFGIPNNISMVYNYIMCAASDRTGYVETKRSDMTPEEYAQLQKSIYSASGDMSANFASLDWLYEKRYINKEFIDIVTKHFPHGSTLGAWLTERKLITL